MIEKGMDPPEDEYNDDEEVCMFVHTHTYANTLARVERENRLVARRELEK